MRCTASNSSDRRDTAPSGVPLTAPAANLSYIRDEFLQEPAPAMSGLPLGSFPGAMARNVLPPYACGLGQSRPAPAWPRTTAPVIFPRAGRGGY